ncbi:uncharacterized protein BX663DRAFT_517942 [Cokeromyces recurvatus]|uniref:uncharacterized protein n=1 Tax=Cokeromyces recurvatus TaxID=90255 RepID=UPI002220FFF2|nr:uncharacterized protein BX663DRAFT_517942 [Cokeromyces recurvatus]KAI7900531.1 hypothetical protein BX663DRAFT_517942 [Cokeromyces recurvatus]
MLEISRNEYQNNLSNVHSYMIHEKMQLPIHDFETYLFQCTDSLNLSRKKMINLKEWLDFIDQYNENNEEYILSDKQILFLQAYYEENEDLWLTPEEFSQLLYMIRLKDEKTSRSRSTIKANIRPKNNKSDPYFVDDIASTNHPDSNQTLNSCVTRKLETYNELEINKKKEKSGEAAFDLSEEYKQYILELENKLQEMQFKIEQQDTIILENKKKDKEKSDTINDLELANDLTDIRNEKLKMELENKKLEIDKLKKHLTVSEEVQNSTTLTELSQAKETIRAYEKKITNTNMQLEQERQTLLETKKELKTQETINADYSVLINKQKLEIEELRNNVNTLTLEEKKNLILDETNLAREQIKAEYMTEIELLKQERDELIQKLKEVSRKYDDQKQRVISLSHQFDQQSELVYIIQTNLTLKQCQRQGEESIQNTRWSAFIYLLPWLLFLFCLLFNVLKSYSLQNFMAGSSYYIYYSPLELLDELYYLYTEVARSTTKSLVDKIFHHHESFL